MKPLILAQLPISMFNEQRGFYILNNDHKFITNVSINTYSLLLIYSFSL